MTAPAPNPNSGKNRKRTLSRFERLLIVAGSALLLVGVVYVAHKYLYPAWTSAPNLIVAVGLVVAVTLLIFFRHHNWQIMVGALRGVVHGLIWILSLVRGFLDICYRGLIAAKRGLSSLSKRKLSPKEIAIIVGAIAGAVIAVFVLADWQAPQVAAPPDIQEEYQNNGKSGRLALPGERTANQIVADAHEQIAKPGMSAAERRFAEQLKRKGEQMRQQQQQQQQQQEQRNPVIAQPIKRKSPPPERPVRNVDPGDLPAPLLGLPNGKPDNDEDDDAAGIAARALMAPLEIPCIVIGKLFSPDAVKRCRIGRR